MILIMWLMILPNISFLCWDALLLNKKERERERKKKQAYVGQQN